MILTGLKLYLGYAIGCIVVPIAIIILVLVSLIVYGAFQEIKNKLKGK